MTPRAGGEADKFGNRYEGAWTTRQLFEVLSGRAQSIQVEPFGDVGRGVEFALRRAGRTEVHQVKRQQGHLGSWTLKALEREGVLEAAAGHVDAGREFHFVSTVPARDLDELSDRARRSDHLKAFIDGQLDGMRLQALFTSLSGIWGGAERTWSVLRSTFVSWPDERELGASNAALAGFLLRGASPLATVAALADLVSENLAVTLDAQKIVDRLSDYGLSRAQLPGTPAASDRVTTATDSWFATIEAELLRPPIARTEVREVIDALSADIRVLLAVGSAGAGKSGVLYQVATGLRGSGWPVLAFRLDRADPFATAEELGEQLRLPASPVPALAAAAGNRDCLLIVDQLDVVSFASGRMPAAFSAVAEIVRQGSAFPAMRVLLACRRFDADNDTRLRGLVSDKPRRALLDVNPLTDEQVADAILAIGVEPGGLTAQQRELLRIPLNLVLLRAIADQQQALDFRTTKELLDAFWERKRRECRERAARHVRFESVIARVAEQMSLTQRLAIPSSVLDAGGLQDDADILKSAHVLVTDGPLIAFFHEAFFDYAFARGWTSRGESLVGFLLAGAQELFRRAQVRQVLLHLRGEDPDRFRRETEDLLRDERVRFHIKDVVLALLNTLTDPTPVDWALVARLNEAGLPFEDRLGQALRTEQWFVCLDDLGVIDGWLSGDAVDRQVRALEVMVSAAGTHPDRIARLLGPHVGRPEFAGWFRWIATWLPFQASRALFDMLLGSVRRGEWDEHLHHLGMVTYGLGEHAPGWACELLAAWLIDRPASLAVEAGRIVDLESGDHGQLELARQGASGAPREFVERLLGYMLEAMAVAESPQDRRPVADVHFTNRISGSDRYRLDDMLLFRMSQALQELTRDQPDAAEQHLRVLAADPHDGAQWLLYQALRAGAPRNANWTVQLLLEGEHRLRCGYNGEPFWTTRQLIQAFGAHFSDEDIARLEQVLLELAPTWESPPGGYAQFTLLSALPEARMSEGARRRLGELRRRVGREQPEEPHGVTVGRLGPPISATAAQHMTDEQWLRAIVKHASERESWTTFTGGAEEQAQVLAQEAEKDPARFARLGLRLGREHNPVYLGAILRALGQTGEELDPDLAFALVRHAASLGQDDLDHWLAWALKKTLEASVPDDVIGIVLDRALHAPHPQEDAWLKDGETGQPFFGGDPFHAGMNSARGESALVLGDLLIHDVDGRRTKVVAEALEELARDPIVAVRSCVARVLAASLRHAPDRAVAAFKTLVDADDRLLATDPVEALTASVGFRDVNGAGAVVARMLGSEWPGVREAGGRLAAFFGLELEARQLFEAARTSEDTPVRAGVAVVCAQRLPYARDGELATRVLRSFFNDPAADVRNAAGGVAATLRDRDLAMHRELLLDLIRSDAFPEARSQLLLTLERSSSAIGDVALAFAERFLERHGDELASIASRAGGDAKEVAELLMRAYAQTPEERRRVLDLIDALLLAGAWRVPDVVRSAER